MSVSSLSLPTNAPIRLPRDFTIMPHGPAMYYAVTVGNEVVELWATVIKKIGDTVIAAVDAIVGELPDVLNMRRSSGVTHCFQFRVTGRGTAVLIAC